MLGFYQPTANCQAFKTSAIALAASINDVNNCLNTDQTLLQTTNLKAEVQLFKGNKLSVFNNFAKKVRNARGASDLNPIETTTPQDAISSVYGVGRRWWSIGPGNATYKAADQWVLSDKLLLDVQWAHVGNNFTLDFHDPSLATVQPTFIINSPAGLNGRSGTQSLNFRPSQVVNVNLNYFAPGKMGGDHAFKFGGYWRDNYSYGNSRVGGDATARFPTAAELASTSDCATIAAGCQVDTRRWGQSIYDLKNIAAYVQDTITHNRVTLQLGIRYDQNHDQALASAVPASMILPTILPAVSFAGADPGIVFHNFSPRIGFTYDIKGDGKTLFRSNYAIYWGQVGDGGVSSQLNPVTAVTARYAWVDANHDTVVQPNEIYDSKGVLLLTGGNPANFLKETGNWNPANPGIADDAEHHRSESQERSDRRVHHRHGSSDWRRLRRRRQLHLAPLRQLLQQRVPRLGAAERRRDGRLELYGRSVHTAGLCVPGGCGLPDADVLPADRPARDDIDRDQHRRLQPRVQRRRTDRPQAAVEPLADEHELQLQQHDRELRRSGQWPPGSRRIRRTSRRATGSNATT